MIKVLDETAQTQGQRYSKQQGKSQGDDDRSRGGWSM